MNIETARKPPKLMERLRSAVKVRHYSKHTENAYAAWVKRFLRFHAYRHPSAMGAAEINAYLTHLAVDRRVSTSTQQQALAAILFLYRHVLDEDVGLLDGIVKATRRRRAPVVLNREECRRLLSKMSGVPKLVATLLYGSGLRLSEALELRVGDVDLVTCEILVREGKGRKDRRTLLPRSLVAPLESHLEAARAQYERDRRSGCGRVPLPHALESKYPAAGEQWGWHYVFPSRSLVIDPKTGVRRRKHLASSTIQKAVKDAAEAADLNRHVGPHTLRHSFASQLVADGVDIRTVQELLGHASVKTTMIYTHVLRREGLGVQSPLDRLEEAGKLQERT